MSFPAYPYIPVSSSIQRPALSYGTFTLDGANDPSVFAGAIESVRRLEVGGNPFFRVRLAHSVGRFSGARAQESFLTFTVHDPAGATVVTASEANAVDDGGDVRDDLREFDVAVTTALGKVDTAGFRVDFSMVFSLAARK